ncbi:MAG: TlpA disulfide reductase family protein [Planctomycetota bacterium]
MATTRLTALVLVPTLCLGALRAQEEGGAIEEFKFDVQTLQGERIKDSDFKDKVVLVDFWGTWCGPCKQAIPHIVKLYDKYRAQGLEVIGLNYREGDNGADKVKRFAREHGIKYHLAMGTDEIMEQVPDFSGFPTMLFFDRGMKFSHLEVGWRNGNEEELEKWVQAALAKEAPDAPEEDVATLELNDAAGKPIDFGKPGAVALVLLAHPKAGPSEAQLTRLRALEKDYPGLFTWRLVRRDDLASVEGAIPVKKQDLAKLRLGKAFPAWLLARPGDRPLRVAGEDPASLKELMGELEKALAVLKEKGIVEPGKEPDKEPVKEPAKDPEGGDKPAEAPKKRRI